MTLKILHNGVMILMFAIWDYLSEFSYNLKGGLSGSDDLAVVKCFRVIFFLKDQTIQFSFSFILYFQQKRAPKLSTCHLLMKSFA